MFKENSRFSLFYSHIHYNKGFLEHGINIFFAYHVWEYGDNIPILTYISLAYYFEEYTLVQAVRVRVTCEEVPTTSFIIEFMIGADIERTLPRKILS